MSGGEVRNRECKLLTGPLRTACSFCKTKITDELKLGPVYESHGLVVHYFCLLTASSLPQNGEDEEGIFGFYLPDIQEELKATATRTCVYCKRKGASVSCCTQKCKRWFHLTCGRKNNSLHQFFGRFKSFCSAHRPKQRVDRDQLGLEESNNDLVCPICYEHVVIDSLDTLWAPCCKKNAWFHRDCVQKLALSAGYFFKCPLCNNEAIFREAMEKFGIYIPQRDALWEQVPNAYQELLYQYRRCDAKDCKCPRGRTHNGQSNWELVRCKTCGSQGVHISCGRLKFSDPEWLCRLCTDVLKSGGTVVRSASPARLPSPSSSFTKSNEVESAVPNTQPDDSQLASNSDSNDSSQGRPTRSNSRPSCGIRSNPSPTPSNVNKPEIVSNSGITSPPIKRSKPCPKRFKKDYVEFETEDKSNTHKTETSVMLKGDTTVSVSKEYPAKASTNNAMVLDSDSDEEIEVLEVHRVLERKSLTANDGTKLEVHPVPEKKKVLYEIRDFPEPSSSTAIPDPEVVTSPRPPGGCSASSTPSNSSSWRSVDPKLFYKPTTSSIEKCDRLTMETSGSPQSLTKENIEALVKGSGCQINQIRTPPKTNSVAAEGKLNSLKPSVTVIPLTTSSCSNPDRIPVKCFSETVPPRPPRPSPSQPLMRNSLTSVALPNQNDCLSLNKPSSPARRKSIEEITIIDEPPQPKPVTTPSFNNLPNFQPKIVNVRSCGNLPNSGSTMIPIRPLVPFLPQTGAGPVLNTNVILCTTGLWLPTSESFLTAPILNPMPAPMAQPVRKPTMPLQAKETDLNIKISDVRHSNEFFNSPSNSLNRPMNSRMDGEMGGRTTLSLPPQGLLNRATLLGSPKPPATSEMSSRAHLTSTKPGTGTEENMFYSIIPNNDPKFRFRKFTPGSSLSIKDSNTTDCSGQKPIVRSKYVSADLPTKSTNSTASDARKELGAGCDSSGIKGDSKSDPASVSSEVYKSITLDNTLGLLTKPEQKIPSIARINRPCPKRFKPTNGEQGTSASTPDLAGEKFVQEVDPKPKRSCRLCPKCLKPRRGDR